jgi:hypothetical protein
MASAVLGITIPENLVFQIGGSALEWLDGSFMFNGPDKFRDAILNPRYNSTWGINFGIDSNYYYYPENGAPGGESRSGLQRYYIRDWGASGYPFVQIDGMDESWLGIFDNGVSNAIVMDNVVTTFANHYGWNTWNQLTYDQYPKILDPQGPVGISVVAMDDSTSSNLGYGDNVYIDGQYIGAIGSTYYVSPQAVHSISVGGEIWICGPSDYMYYDGTYGYGYFYTAYDFSYFDYICYTDGNNPSYFTTYDNPLTLIAHYYPVDYGVYWYWTE